jgi:hypothetical protein
MGKERLAPLCHGPGPGLGRKIACPASILG